MEREYGEESVSWSANTETPEERHRRIYGPADPFGRAQWLRERADTLDAEGRLLRGTCFLGDISPSSAKHMQANELREHARLLLESVEHIKPKKP